MASDVKLYLREELLKTDVIVLEIVGYDTTPPVCFDSYEREQDESDLRISIHIDTEEPLIIVLEEFVSGTELAVKMLREYPLPWTFSLPSMKIKEKPLEDVLLAVWKKHKNIKMEGE